MSHRALKTLGIIAILVLLISTVQAEDWPMYRHDLAHSGTTSEVVEPPLKLLWKFKTDGAVSYPPAVYDGLIYVSSADNCIYALDAKSGNLKWKYNP